MNDELDLREVEPGVYSLLRNGASLEARVIPEDAGAYRVEIGGQRFTIEVRDPRAPTRRSGTVRGGHQNITAPMPGKVVRLLVTEGQDVETGQGLIVVEAMKMQNEMKAAKSGKVIKIHASHGSTVAAGEVLLTLE